MSDEKDKIDEIYEGGVSKLPERAEENEDGSIQVTLEHPFTWIQNGEDAKVESVRVPRIKAHHMRGINGKALENGDMDEVFKLVQKLLGEPKSYVDKIDMADFKTIGEVLNYFLPDGPTTGGTA